MAYTVPYFKNRQAAFEFIWVADSNTLEACAAHRLKLLARAARLTKKRQHQAALNAACQAQFIREAISNREAGINPMGLKNLTTDKKQDYSRGQILPILIGLLLLGLMLYGWPPRLPG